MIPESELYFQVFFLIYKKINYVMNSPPKNVKKLLLLRAKVKRGDLRVRKVFFNLKILPLEGRT